MERGADFHLHRSQTTVDVAAGLNHIILRLDAVLVCIYLAHPRHSVHKLSVVSNEPWEASLAVTRYHTEWFILLFDCNYGNYQNVGFFLNYYYFWSISLITGPIHKML